MKQRKNSKSPLLAKTRRNLISKINVIARDPKKGLQMDLDNARKKRNRAGNAVKKQIEFEDDLLRQSKDIIALTAGLEGLQMKMDSLKSLHETIVNSYCNARVA